MRGTFVVVAVVFVSAATACGGGGGRESSARSIVEAAARTAAAATGRYELRIVASGREGALSVQAAGAFDGRRHRFSLATDFSGFVPGLDGPTAIVATSDALFIDCPALARALGVSTKWLSVRGAAVELVRPSVVDPAGLLGALRSGRLGSDRDLDVVVGDDGLVHRITMRFDAAGQGGGVLLTLEYFDVGASVAIEPPRADEVTDETGAVNRLFGGTTGG